MIRPIIKTTTQWLQQDAIETARAFVRACATAGLVFDKVFLFGYAKGTADEASDIDLL